jgi:hypothetical protein
MPPQEMIEPASAAVAGSSAAASDRGALGGSGMVRHNSLSNSSSLKKVIELWHGRHHNQHQTNAAGERVATPDSLSAPGRGGAGGAGDGVEALLSESRHHLQDQDGGGGGWGKELLAIVNPSAESLCQALAYGVEWTAGRKGGGGARRGRCKGSEAASQDGEAEEKDPEAEADGEEEKEDGAGPLPLDALPAAALDDLPHNRWLSLPLHKAGAAADGGVGTGTRAAAYEIDMPLIPGPAVVFFYSPYGRLRLRGVLRDDGAEPSVEME